MLPLVFNWNDANKTVTHSKRSLRDTFNDIFNDKVIFYFLIAYWVYIDGVDTIIRMAVNYGLTLGFTPDHLLIALLVTQFVAFPGTLLINKLAQYTTPEFGIMF